MKGDRERNKDQREYEKECTKIEREAEKDIMKT